MRFILDSIGNYYFPGLKMLSKAKINDGVTFSLITLPILIAVLYIKNYSVNVPFAHDWVFFTYILEHDSSEWIQYFWLPQNGHRNLFVQLFYLFSFKYFKFNTTYHAYINLFVMLLSLWSLEIYKHLKQAPLTFIPISYLF